MASVTPSHFFKQIVAPHYGDATALASIHKTLWDMDNKNIYYLVNYIAEIGGESTTDTPPAALPRCGFEREEHEFLNVRFLTGKRLFTLAQNWLTVFVGESKYSLAKPKIASFTKSDMGNLYSDLFLVDPHLRYAVLAFVSKLVEGNVAVYNNIPKACNHYVINEVNELIHG